MIPAPTDSERIGALLREAREALGLDLREIAASLRIRLAYLQAIEDGRFNDLPGLTYAIGFVRTYADHVRMDSDALVASYKASVGEAAGHQELVFPTPVPRGRFPSGSVISLSVVLAVLAFAGWFFLEDRQVAEIGRVPPPPALASIPSPTDPGGPTGNPADATADGSRIGVGAVDGAGQAFIQDARETPPAVGVTDTPAAATLATSVASVVTAESDGAAAGEAAVPATDTDGSVPADVEVVVPGTDTDGSVPADVEVVVPATDTDGSAPEATLTPAEPDPTASAPAPVPTVASESAAAVLAEATAPEDTDSALPADASPGVILIPVPPRVTTADEPPEDGAAGSNDVEVVVAEPEDAPSTEAVAAGTPIRLGPAPTIAISSDAAAEASLPTPPGLPEVPPIATGAGTDGRVYGLANQDARIVLRAVADSWVQVRDRDQNVLLTRMLRSGDSYNVPNRQDLLLLTGNAGGLEISVDGEVVPSLGPAGAVRRDVSLDAELLKAGRAAAR